MDDDGVDPLDVFLEQFTVADAGQLLAAAAEFHPDDPAHAAAWADVHAVARAEGMEAQLERLRERVANWATQGTGVTVGHLGVGPADAMSSMARAAAAGPIVDAGVVEMLGTRLDPETCRVLLRPWGLPEIADDEGA